MNDDYLGIANITKEVQIPANGIISRTLFSDDRMRVVLFGFDKDQELTEHTSSMAAVIHILQGEAKLTLGQDVMEAREGTWVRMRPHLPHTVYATTPVVMLLTMVKAG